MDKTSLSREGRRGPVSAGTVNHQASPHPPLPRQITWSLKVSFPFGELDIEWLPKLPGPFPL